MAKNVHTTYGWKPKGKRKAMRAVKAVKRSLVKDSGY